MHKVSASANFARFVGASIALIALIGVVALVMDRESGDGSPTAPAPAGSSTAPAPAGSSTAPAPAGSSTETGSSGASNPGESAFVTPMGVYVASLQSMRIDPAALDAPYVDGFFVAFDWATIEPQPGSFDWSRVDAVLDDARSHGKALSLAFRAGDGTPAWVYETGARSLDFTVATHSGSPDSQCNHVTVPVFWDAAFLQQLSAMVDALRAHLGADPAAYASVRQLKVGGINLSTEEVRAPAQSAQTTSGGCDVTDAPATWLSVGYRPALVVDAWRQIIATWGAAFPDKSLGMSIIPTGAFPAIDDEGHVLDAADTNMTDALVREAVHAYGSRVAVQHNSLTANHTEDAVTQAAELGATVGAQLNGLRYASPQCPNVRILDGRTATPCDPSEFRAAIDTGLQLGMRYIEVFNNDVIAYPDELQYAHDKLAR